MSDKFGVLDLQINNIDTIRARKKYAARGGAMIGAVMGALIGAVINSQSDDNFFTAETKAIFGAAIGSLPGALIGAGVGSVKIKIPINGSMNNFHKYKDELKKYSTGRKQRQ